MRTNEQMHQRLNEIMTEIQGRNPEADEARIERLFVEQILSSEDDELARFLMEQVEDELERSHGH
jgi:hypothetical protein